MPTTDKAQAYPVVETGAVVPATVCIPAAEHAALLESRRQLAELNARLRAFKLASKSPICRDPELATFFGTRLGMAAVKTIRAECGVRFGHARTPSKSAVYSYWKRLRLQMPT